MFVAHIEARVLAFSPEGEDQANIALVSGERVVAASLDGHVLGIGDNERLWSVERGAPGAHDSSPQPNLIVGADGTVYTGSWTERLFAIR